MAKVAAYHLRKSDIVQLLQDTTFYTECPAFLFMREQGLVASQKYIKRIRNKQGGRHEDDIISPAMSSFLRMLRLCGQHCPEQLIALKLLISLRLGYTPEQVFVYYVGEAGQKVRFEF